MEGPASHVATEGFSNMFRSCLFFLDLSLSLSFFLAVVLFKTNTRKHKELRCLPCSKGRCFLKVGRLGPTRCNLCGRKLAHDGKFVVCRCVFENIIALQCSPYKLHAHTTRMHAHTLANATHTTPMFKLTPVHAVGTSCNSLL